MSFWTNCKKCGSRVYMAKVQPRNEYYSRWLPFDDDSLLYCHLENCFSQSSPTTITSNKKSKSKKQVELIKCPICKVKVRKDKLKRHNSKVHNNKEKPKVIRCPICQSSVREDRFKKHNLKVHNGKDIPIPKEKSKLIMKCPICQVAVREDRLEKHMLNVH